MTTCLGAGYSGAICRGRQVGRQQPHGRCADAGVARVDDGDVAQRGRGEQENASGHGEAAARLIGGHRFGRVMRRADHAHDAVVCVVQLEFQPQAPGRRAVVSAPQASVRRG